jgi:hypothetical protein
MTESNESTEEKKPAESRVAGRYVVWVMAAIVVACLGLAAALANRATPDAVKFHDKHSPQP